MDDSSELRQKVEADVAYIGTLGILDRIDIA